MTDLVETLRQWARDYSTDVDADVFASAADEIERLSKQLVKCRDDLREYGQHNPSCDYDRPEWPRCTCGLSKALALPDEQQKSDPDEGLPTAEDVRGILR